jgi:hypothetical protein
MNQKEHKELLRKTHWKTWHDFFNEMIKFEYRIYKKMPFKFGLCHPFKYTKIEGRCDCCNTPIGLTQYETFEDRELVLCYGCYKNYKIWLKGG